MLATPSVDMAGAFSALCTACIIFSVIYAVVVAIIGYKLYQLHKNERIEHTVYMWHKHEHRQ